MKISPNAVVAIDYTLKNDAGEVIDTSTGKTPLTFMFGTGHLIPGLEKALEDKAVGDKFSVSIPPEDAYGHVDDTLFTEVPKTQFEDHQIEVGMQFQAKTNEGAQIVTITEINDDSIVVNGNHALAGQTLHFDVSIVSVREATQEEIDHGHVHDENTPEH